MEVNEILNAFNAVKEELEDEEGTAIDVQLYTTDDELHLFVEAENSSGADYRVADADDAGRKFAEYLKRYVL